MIHATRALVRHDLSGEGIKLCITYILFWPHKDMEGLPRWVISTMPGPPPRQHKHERQYTPVTYSVIPTRRIWNDDCGGQMIFVDLVGLKFPDICLTGEGKPHPGNLSERGPAACQAGMLPPVPRRWTLYCTFVAILYYNIAYTFKLIIIIIREFCLRAGISQQTQEPRLLCY